MTDSLQTYHQQFITSLEEKNRAHSTVLAYGKDVEQLLEFANQQGADKPKEITQDHIKDFKKSLKDKRYTNKSISRKINSIKSFFRFLMTQDVINNNPADDIAHPKIQQQLPNLLTPVEYRALRDACKHDPRISAIVELLLQTGMRISELAALQLEDVNFTKQTVLIRGKNSRSDRVIPLNDAAKNALKRYIAVRPKTKEQTIFLTKTCRPFLVRNIRTAIDRYFRLAGIEDAKVNDLRHTFIVEQLKAGTPLVYVSQLVGHKRITTTEKYLQMIPEKKEPRNVDIEEL